MATLPSVQSIAPREPTPQTGAVSYQPSSGYDEAPSEGATKFGETVQNVAMQQQEALNTTRAEDAWNQYKSTAMDLAVGQDGFTTKLGGNAVNGQIYQTYSNQLGTARNAITATLGDDDVRRRFQERANVTDLQFKDQLLKHYTEQRNVYEKQTFDGTMAAASSMVAAAPLDQGIFDTSLLNATRRAKDLAQHQGITDQDSIDKITAGVKDQLLTKRIDSLVYSNPSAADTLFRLTSDQITNPETRLLMQHKVNEAALGVNSANDANDLINQARQKLTQRPQYKPTVEGGPTPAGALIDAVANQESGEDATAVSPKGAMGTMQLMPATAKQVSTNLGIPYNEALLTANTPEGIAYNKQLGTAYLNDQLKRFGGNQTLALAAYNAGPELVSDWMNGTNTSGKNPTNIHLGNPNAGEISNADFAANIPFNETKAYVSKISAAVNPDGLQNATYTTTDPMAQNTSGLPNTRDLATMWPLMASGVEAKANERYGTDTGNPDRAAYIARTRAELHARINDDVQQMNAIQKQSQGILMDAIVSGRAAGAAGGTPGAPGATGGQVLTSFSQIQSDPQLMRAWQLTDPQMKPYLLNMLQKNITDTDGDPILFRQLFNRIHLEPGDPQKIEMYKQITDPSIANRLSMPMINQLRSEIDRDETPGGRSLNQMRKMGDFQASLYFKTNPMFLSQPDRQIAAINRWNQDVGNKIDALVKSGHPEDVRKLFMAESPESVIDARPGKYLSTYIDSTPAQGLAAQSAASQKNPQAPMGQPTAAPKTEAERDSLPPGTVYVDPAGKVRQRPGTAPTAAPTDATSQPGPAAAVGAPLLDNPYVKSAMADNQSASPAGAVPAAAITPAAAAQDQPFRGIVDPNGPGHISLDGKSYIIQGSRATPGTQTLTFQQAMDRGYIKPAPAEPAAAPVETPPAAKQWTVNKQGWISMDGQTYNLPRTRSNQKGRSMSIEQAKAEGYIK